MSTEEKLITGVWLCAEKADPLLEAIRPEWNEQVSLTLAEKISMLNESFSWDDLFPFGEHLTQGLDSVEWAISLLKQPELFIRIRPGRAERLLARLKELDVAHSVQSATCLSFSAATNLDAIGELNRDYVVQDYSSQRVGELLKLIATEENKSIEQSNATVDLSPSVKTRAVQQPLRVWDCCAASGGKSILAADLLGNFILTVSDVRASILSQLRKRLSEAGVTHYHSLQVNLEKEIPPSLLQSTDLLIADVPCSGSGTWGRTPEQLCFFKEEQIAEYAAKQKIILSNALRSLSSGGYLLYITCSVFKEENEEQVAWLTYEKGMQLVKSSLFKGVDKKADTLYAALLQWP